MPHGPNFHFIPNTIKALDSPWRRHMLETVAVEPCGLARMCELLPITPQTVSYHLDVLHRTGMLHVPWGAGAGRFVYQPAFARLDNLRDYIDACLLPSWYIEQRYPPKPRQGADGPPEGTAAKVLTLMSE